jgi:hypothetical protein
MMKELDQKRGWPLQFSFLEPPTALSIPLSVISILIFVTFVLIAILALSWLFTDLVSGDQRRASEAAKTALPILAGAIGLPLIIWRLRILDRQTRISDEKTQIDRETHYTSIFSRSIEQLGQTREMKSFTNVLGTIDAITRTVPNIEVRLGGIHSLVRLAEESRRDRAKIENTLLSYVRENSWFNRDSEKAIYPTLPHQDSLAWRPGFRRETKNNEAESAYKKWVTDVEKNKKVVDGWRMSCTRFG